MSHGIDLKEISIFRDNNTLIFRDNNTLMIRATNDGSPVNPPKGTIQLTIPMNLINGINSVTTAATNGSHSAEQNLGNRLASYQIQSNYQSDTILVNINVGERGDFMISVKGTETLRDYLRD